MSDKILKRNTSDFDKKHNRSESF